MTTLVSAWNTGASAPDGPRMIAVRVSEDVADALISARMTPARDGDLERLNRVKNELLGAVGR